MSYIGGPPAETLVVGHPHALFLFWPGLFCRKWGEATRGRKQNPEKNQRIPSVPNMYKASAGLPISSRQDEALPIEQVCPRTVAVVVESAVKPQKTANAVVVVVVVIIIVVVVVILVLMAVKSSSHSNSTTSRRAEDLPTLACRSRRGSG
jgi:hypothetical protein